MKPSGDLILRTERRRLAFYLLRSHLVGHHHTSSTVDPNGSPADRHAAAAGGSGDRRKTAPFDPVKCAAAVIGDGSTSVKKNIPSAVTAEVVDEWNTWAESVPQTIGDMNLPPAAPVAMPAK